MDSSLNNVSLTVLRQKQVTVKFHSLIPIIQITSQAPTGSAILSANSKMYGAAQESGDRRPLINIYLLHVEDAPAQVQGTGEHHHRLLMANMLGMDMGMPGGQQPHSRRPGARCRHSPYSGVRE